MTEHITELDWVTFLLRKVTIVNGRFKYERGLKLTLISTMLPKRVLKSISTTLP